MFAVVVLPRSLGAHAYGLSHLGIAQASAARVSQVSTHAHTSPHLLAFAHILLCLNVDAVVYQYFAHENNNKTGIWRNAGQTQNIILLDINRIDYPSITPLLQTQETISVVA